MMSKLFSRILYIAIGFFLILFLALVGFKYLGNPIKSFFQHKTITVVAPQNKKYGVVTNQAAPEKVALAVMRISQTWHKVDNPLQRDKTLLQQHLITRSLYDALDQQKYLVEDRNYDTKYKLIAAEIKNEHVYRFQSLGPTVCEVWIAYRSIMLTKTKYAAGTVYLRERLIKITNAKLGESYWSVENTRNV